MKSSSSPGASVSKVVSLTELARLTEELQSGGRTVALCHGCFDILHVGHLRHFEAAARMADAVIVTVTPDRFVGKGPNRPVFSERERVGLIAGLAVVTAASVNEWPSAVEVIRTVRPTLYVKGGEYEDPGADVNPLIRDEIAAALACGVGLAFTHEMTLSSTAAYLRSVT